MVFHLGDEKEKTTVYASVCNVLSRYYRCYYSVFQYSDVFRISEEREIRALCVCACRVTSAGRIKTRTLTECNFSRKKTKIALRVF